MIDILIVNWNGLHFCLPLLAQLRKPVDAGQVQQVIVVDNGSTDGSAEKIAAEFSWVRLVRSPANLGYAGGNNLGLPLVSAPYVWLLNNDTEICDDTILDRLQKVLDDDPQCAAVAPALILPSGKFQTGAGGADFGLTSTISYFLFFARVFPKHIKPWFLPQLAYQDHADQVDVDWLCGAAMLVRSDALRAVGGVPAEQFMYAEDIRLCRLLRQRGDTIKYLPSARLTHVHGGSASASQPNSRWIDATLRDAADAVAPWKFPIIQTTFVAGFFLRWLTYRALAAVTCRDDLRQRSAAMRSYATASANFRTE